MAELNFGLLNPPGSQSIGNAFVTGMDQAAAARAQENQNALSQYTLAKAKREDELTNQMLAGMQGADTIEKQADVLRRGGRYKEANELLTFGLERDIKKGTLAAQPGLMARTAAQTDAANFAAGKSGQDFRNQGLRDMANNPSDANIVANHEDAVLRGMMTREESDAQTVKLLAIPLAQRKAIFAQAGAPAAAPEATSQDIRTMQALGYPPTPAGYILFRDAQRPERLLTPEEEAQRVRIAGASRAPAQPRPDRLLTPEEEAQKIRIAQGSRPPPVETRPLTAQQQLKARETQVAQRGVVKSADTAATELETLADNLLGNPDKKIPPNPGLGGITGYMGLVPSLPKTAARSAQQQLDTFKGKVMAFGRLLATQQGKLGNMAVSEWKFISDAIEKIDPLANNFDTQLRDVVRQAKDFAAAKRETFDELYDSTTSTGGANAPQTPVDLQSAAQAEIARRANAKR